MNRPILQSPMEALSDAIGLWFRDEGEARCDAPELDLIEKVAAAYCVP